MPNRNRDPNRDFDRDWSGSGPDYEKVGRGDTFRRPSDRGGRRDERDASRPTRGWDGEPMGPRDYGDYGDYSHVAGLPRFGYPDAQRDRGGFFGRGPKGYRRSDERIQEEISDRLMASPDIDASDLEVHVANGIVTLSGTVDNRHEKRIAEYIAEDSMGVNDVSNQLKVRHGFWATITGERVVERDVERKPDRDVGKPSAEGGRASAARNAAARREDAR